MHWYSTIRFTSILWGAVVGEKRLTTFPSWSTKNLVKFHLILSPKVPCLLDFKNLYSGDAFEPLTWIWIRNISSSSNLCKQFWISCNSRKILVSVLTLSNTGYSALNLVQTKFAICSVVPGSWPANWLHGKARISKPAQSQP